jgi:hypothetical protein
VSHPHDDTAPVEHDPTGMRALLSSLPDPGPMPADLVARISAALEAEAHAGAQAREGAQLGSGLDELWSLQGADSAGGPAGAGAGCDDEAPAPGGRVVPLRRRVGLRHLGVAAAVVGVLGVGGYLVQALPGGGTASSSSFGAADSGAGADSSAGSKAQSAPEVAPAAGSGAVVVVMSGVDHRSSRLEVTARELDDGTLDPIADLSAESPSLGPIATPIGARACADALGIPADAGILVDLSEVDGVSAAVLVVHTDTGRSAWAVDRSCTTDNTGLIRGPVPLD